MPPVIMHVGIELNIETQRHMSLILIDSGHLPLEI